jgi:hypothetical protein
MRKLVVVVSLVLLGSCTVRESASDVREFPQDRRLLGAPAALQLDAVDANELASSMAARRKMAWSVAARVIEKVRVGELDGLQIDTPRFRTWLDGDELVDLFTAYHGLRNDPTSTDPAARFEAAQKAYVEKRAPLFDTDEAWKRYLATLTDPTRQMGLSGRQRTAFGGSFARHVVLNADRIAACKAATEAGIDAAPPSDTNHAACFDAEFPADAIMIKPVWQRFSKAVKVFSTDAASLSTLLAADSPAEWLATDRIPGDQLTKGDIFTVSMPDNPLLIDSSSEFRLVALHIATKTTREWQWMTLWWSPAASANDDFGADRPAGFGGDEPAWKHYKMCVASAYDELDSAPGASFQESAPTLAAALAVTAKEAGQHTWCSNPYVELGAGNARTNCIGCHQHAGSAVDPDSTFRPVADGGQPAFGRSRVRKNHPSDYTWAAHNDDALFDRIVEVLARERP